MHILIIIKFQHKHFKYLDVPGTRNNNKFKIVFIISSMILTSNEEEKSLFADTWYNQF